MGSDTEVPTKPSQISEAKAICRIRKHVAEIAKLAPIVWRLNQVHGSSVADIIATELHAVNFPLLIACPTDDGYVRAKGSV